MVEIPPPKLLISDLRDLLKWYEENLRGQQLLDPRGHRVVFDSSRFPYMIKLRTADGQKVKKPSRAVEKIRMGEVANRDFGGFDPERAQTLSWLPVVITRPTMIATNRNLLIPGDELFVKEFRKYGYRYKVLYCKRMSPNLLVPVTSFPKSKLGKLAVNVLWPQKTTEPPRGGSVCLLLYPEATGKAGCDPAKTLQAHVSKTGHPCQ